VTYTIRFTREAEDDLVRLYEFVLARDSADWVVAERALQAIKQGISGLAFSPFSYRKAGGSPFLRELVIPFGTSGYVVLYEIEDFNTLTIIAVRHQREDDYH
jgi:plasmid stabilization system protein ParE